MAKVLFLDDLKICVEVCRLDDERLLTIWGLMAKHGFNPHAWHDKKDRVTQQQWHDSLESELVRRRLL